MESFEEILTQECSVMTLSCFFMARLNLLWKEFMDFIEDLVRKLIIAVK